MKITLVGDIFPADEFLSVGFGIRSQFEATKGERWKDNIQGITQDSDIVIGNLESPLLEPSLAAGKPDFYGSLEFARFLRECGIGVLNVANNHILEHGKGGYERTLQILEESGIAVAGNDNRVLYIHRDNCLIGIAGFCNVDLDKFDNDGCFSVLDEVNAMAALNEMADRKADLKILTLHWGNEYIHRPSMMQRNMAYRLIDAGADIIVGHHSHVIQPYEKYKAGHIFYSLGNFCFDKPFQSRQFSKGMGVDLYFDTDSKEIEKIEIFGIKLSFRHLMHRMPADSFKPYFAGIQNKYERLKCDTTYDTGYSEELSKRRMIERILMKLSLIQTFFFVSFKEKRMLINNLINYYFKI